MRPILLQTRSFFAMLAAGVTVAASALPFLWAHQVKREILLAQPGPLAGQMLGLVSDKPHNIPATGFRGDRGGFARTLTVFRSVHPSRREALLALANADTFAGRQIGIAGGPSEYSQAFDLMLKDPIAVQAFRELVLRATPAGKVYGLCGLYRVQPDTLPLARAWLVGSSASPVTVFDSCMVRDVTVADLAADPQGTCSILAPDEKLQ